MWDFFCTFAVESVNDSDTPLYLLGRLQVWGIFVFITTSKMMMEYPTLPFSFSLAYAKQSQFIYQIPTDSPVFEMAITLNQYATTVLMCFDNLKDSRLTLGLAPFIRMMLDAISMAGGLLLVSDSDKYANTFLDGETISKRVEVGGGKLTNNKILSEIGYEGLLETYKISSNNWLHPACVCEDSICDLMYNGIVATYNEIECEISHFEYMMMVLVNVYCDIFKRYLDKIGVKVEWDTEPVLKVAPEEFTDYPLSDFFKVREIVIKKEKQQKCY